MKKRVDSQSPSPSRDNADVDPASDDLLQTIFDPLKSGLAMPSEAHATQIDFSVLEADLFSPQRRLPNPKLVVVDDHSASDGEVIRVRKQEFLIGRREGDLIIESDFEMSSKHAMLHCKLDNGRMRWRLSDTGSTNGTFVRVARAPLTHGRELILGLQRYRVELTSSATATPGAATAEAAELSAQTGLDMAVFPLPLPKGNLGGPVVEQPLRLVNTADAKESFQVTAARTMLGSNPKRCKVAIEDRCLSAEHAKLIFRRGKWQIEDHGSLNGVWVRVRSVWLDRHAEFQLGEQRFRFFADGQIV